MPPEITALIGGNLVILLLAGFILLSLFLGIRIVPQSEIHLVEKFGRVRSGPGSDCPRERIRGDR